MTAPLTDAQAAQLDFDKLRKAAEKATPGPWDVWREPTRAREDAIAEFTDQVRKTEDFAEAVYLLNANGKCPATTGCGPTSEANAAYIALANPATILALLDEREAQAERIDELESNGEAVAAEFEGDCWKAMRSLLNECHFDWSGVDDEGVPADDARYHISECLAQLARDEKSARDRAEAAEAERADLWRANRELQASIDLEKALVKAAEAEAAALRKALERICNAAARRDLHGNGALDDVVPPYLIEDARSALITKGTAE